ncbi:AAA domain-containing protein [Roseburia sp. 831b]|uniref:AAA domain-containing protein n=1 Tax=Roseburia sp. 831b TaxID=1261635 RepID=UPI000B10E794|nr:AAA domain-containing protein [Roseburia sp. 831b]WVK74190.1 AAA domain-containing protein [Roseburia sp. 831b]
MANEKDFTKAIADIIGAGIVGVTVTAMVKGGKSSSDKESSNSQPQKASEDIFEEERVKQEMDEMWGKNRMMQQSTYDSERINMANRNDNYMDSYYRDDEYEEDEYEDEDEFDEDDDIEEEIDNSEMSFFGRNICILLNDNEEDRRNRLRTSEAVLVRKFPKLKQLSSTDRMQQILDGMFPEGFQKQMYVRNLTFTGKSGYDVKTLGIRPERTPGDFLEGYLPDDVSLLFKGHIAGKEFRVDSVFEVMDTEQLDFEVDVVATPYPSPERIGANFLYDILDNSGSLTEYTGEKLEEWKQYLDWKRELASRQIYGCKYFKVGFDEEKKRLNFWLVFEDQDTFKAFKKYLSRDIQVFDNNYSKDKWHFDFAGDINNRRQRFNSVELGRYRGVVNEYYLKDNSEYFDDDTEEKHILTEEEWMSGDYDDEEVSKRSIYDAYSNPYIVQVAYDLNRRDIDEINHRNLDDEETIQYVYDNILGNYYTDGFLALSAIGDFVLIRRFQQAIDQLERDECYSPNLAMWLFDVTRARVPKDIDIDIDKWLNPKIEKNENQKEAVRKMLAAPDLCLIQGPPGTGKTTVIAEAIYQFVRRGDRVLVASQSNDAVDNALERLADSPEIRAIRLGQKGRRKRKVEDLSTRKFGEDEALKYYYHALSLQLSKNWLDLWDSLESGGIQYDTDIRDASLFNQDIAALNEELSGLNQEYDDARKHLALLTSELEKANDDNTKLEEDKHQYRLAYECFKGKSDSQFYLSEDLLKIFESKLNKLVEITTKAGIYLTPGVLDIDVMGLGKEQAYVYMISKNLKTLKGLCEKIQKVKGNDNSNDGEILILNSQLADVKQKLLECLQEDDTDGASQYTKEMKSLQKKVDKLKFSSSVVTISDIEKNILNKNVIEGIETNDADKWLETFRLIIDKWSQAINSALDAIKETIESRKSLDVSDIISRRTVAEGKILEINERIDSAKAQIVSKRQTLLKLREKYEIESTNADDIIAHIKKLKENNIRQLNEQREFRNDWEKTIRGFKDRLDDADAFKYDQEYYQQIYVNACNVVGISCTDNMRNLSDNGYNDFDVVIIDEVSKATPPELLIPLMKARKAILVGDHRQLPPMFKEHEGSYKELAESQENAPEEVRDLLTQDNFKRFQKMVTSSLFKDYFEQADEKIKHSLLVQYRMHTDIMDIINRFYEQRLSCGNSEEVERMEKSHDLTIKGVDGSTFVTPTRHAYWIDSSFTPSNKPIYEVRPNNSTSNCNVLEKYIIIELLKKIADSYREQGYNKNNQKTVGVISFYQMQVNEIREAFREVKKVYDFSAIDVDINTVDRFQGKEKNIIITSLVRNNEKGHASKHVVAFERINVAFSRAQELLFIVGAKHMYENQPVQLPNMDMPGFKTAPVYKNIMEGLNRKGCFKTCNKIITPEIEEKIIAEYKEMGGKL